MGRLPFEKIEEEAQKLIQKIAEATSNEESDYYHALLEAFLEGAGWTNEEFDAKLLKKIDANWEDKELN